MCRRASITDVLRARRIALGLSQADIAGLMNACENQISVWETGKILPRIDRLEEWGRALGLTLHWTPEKDQDHEP